MAAWAGQQGESPSSTIAPQRGEFLTCIV